MIKALIFDIEGVVIPNLDNVIDTYIKKVLSINDSTFKQLWGAYVDKLTTGEISEVYFWELINSDLGRKQKIPKDVFTTEYYNNFQINDGLLQIVATLRGNGYGTCVLSNSIYPFSQHNRKIGLYQNFDYVLLSDEIGFSKPDKRAFQFALDKLNLPAGDLVFIDDKQENIDKAKTMGFVTHKYQDNFKLQNELVRMGLFRK